MSSCIGVPSEQVCYIPCNFCNIVLAVNVPCSSLLDVVTVRCGHCTNLWSVNMAAVLQSLSWQDLQDRNRSGKSRGIPSNLFFPTSTTVDHQTQNFISPDFNFGSSSSRRNFAVRPSNTVTEERIIVNRPPEKRQRVPSAYNQFIKEEIHRIKTNNPEISHREAFSTAAKNWAHFPHIHFGLMLETGNKANLDEGPATI